MNGLKILYLEDTEKDLATVTNLFQNEKVEVNLKHTDNRDEFLELFNEFKPDIILSELKTASFDGFEALDIIRSEDNEIPFIFLSCDIDEATAIKLFKSGATDYVLKNRISRLVPAITRALLEIHERAKRIHAEKTQQKYDFIVNTSKSMFTLIDRNYVYEAVNDAFCKAHNLVREKIIGKSLWDLWGKDTFEKFIKNNCDQSFSDNVVRYQAWFHVPYHGMRCFEVTFYPYKEHGTEVTHSVVNTMDITDETKLQNYLQRAQRMETVGTLAGGIAHDFNNILATIIGHADIALHDLPKEHPSYRDLEQIMKASNRARELVNHILTFSRQMESKTEPVQLLSHIEEVVKMLEGSISPDIKIKTELNIDCPSVPGDPSHIRQVIMNICTNAIHAMCEKEGLLKIRMDCLKDNDKLIKTHPELKKKKYIRIDFIDTGKGINPDIIDRIFEPFFTTKPVGEGTGLGLSVVHGMIKNMQGDIFVESTPGKGSKFTIVLPAWEE